MKDRLTLHAEALADADRAVRQALAGDLSRPSRCEGWSVADLADHMTGQNLGFAAAIRSGDAPAERYVARSHSEWALSVEVLRESLSQPAGAVVLAEVAPGRPLPLDSVLGIHALDLAVHTWDLNSDYRPGEELAELVLTIARATPPRSTSGGPFAPAIAMTGQDPWLLALGLLGRSVRIERK